MKVAIIGASNQREKFGNKAVRSYVAGGHKVYPVNPKESVVEGLTAWSTVQEIPEVLDRVLLYVPPAVGVMVLDGIAQKGVAEVYVNPGAGSEELFRRGEDLGLNLVRECAIVASGDTPSRYP